MRDRFWALLFPSVSLGSTLAAAGLVLCLLAGSGCTDRSATERVSFEEMEGPDVEPRTYAVYRAAGAVRVDGRLSESDWAEAPWTADFVDIEGDDAPAPRFRTRAKMLWDEEALYVAAELEEPDVWATLTQRDTVIFYDNDFEVFVDPTGTTHNYYELEVNALETVWDLMLLTPYRDGGPALDPDTPLYSGLFVPELSPDELVAAVGHAREGGASGVSLFDVGNMTDAHWDRVSEVLAA